ncbi:MarC family protein [Salidesulfovibrio onnuriiensis]|uniref:MarC family protein n=1 Tax=Salidesulfovibrio onnuriiensis TaxID=2583823 RepID=UPI0011CB8B99|nr:MarC family protein [Salidesulfovibrio onnuriiensis]
MTSLFFSLYIKLFFLLTPFFVLTVFLSMTKGMELKQQRSIAVRVACAAIVIGLVLYSVGNEIFATLDITLDAFRIGAGSLLFLSAVKLVGGRSGPEAPEEEGDISVVPLAIPVTIGPATIGTLLILGAELGDTTQKLLGAAALVAAGMSIGVLLLLGPAIRRLVGKMGLSMLQKITGLVLSALAAQIVFTGIRNFLG